mmetsp:Transcript_99649/g.136983  ORF Transcript_99649/g.136983 Transcript_99649/m.136983 type:complete len:136 (-) Transcript_99649:53-460(-)
MATPTLADARQTTRTVPVSRGAMGVTMAARRPGLATHTSDTPSSSRTTHILAASNHQSVSNSLTGLPSLAAPHSTSYPAERLTQPICSALPRPHPSSMWRYKGGLCAGSGKGPIPAGPSTRCTAHPSAQRSRQAP